MTVREGADSLQGRCSIMCAVEKLAEGCPVDFSLSLYPFQFGITRRADSCDTAGLLPMLKPPCCLF